MDMLIVILRANNEVPLKLSVLAFSFKRSLELRFLHVQHKSASMCHQDVCLGYGIGLGHKPHHVMICYGAV
jgi:hypothetical protein